MVRRRNKGRPCQHNPDLSDGCWIILFVTRENLKYVCHVVHIITKYWQSCPPLGDLTLKLTCSHVSSWVLLLSGPYHCGHLQNLRLPTQTHASSERASSPKFPRFPLHMYSTVHKIAATTYARDERIPLYLDSHPVMMLEDS